MYALAPLPYRRHVERIVQTPSCCRTRPQHRSRGPVLREGTSRPITPAGQSLSSYSGVLLSAWASSSPRPAAAVLRFLNIVRPISPVCDLPHTSRFFGRRGSLCRIGLSLEAAEYSSRVRHSSFRPLAVWSQSPNVWRRTSPRPPFQAP
jgi:hypothetical protein